MTFDSKRQRKILGHFATGVTVVTTGGVAGLHGMTANAVASLSLEPPLVLVAVDKRAITLDYLKKNRCFAINILRVGAGKPLPSVRNAGAERLLGIEDHDRGNRVANPDGMPGLPRLQGGRHPAGG